MCFLSLPKSKVHHRSLSLTLFLFKFKIKLALLVQVNIIELFIKTVLHGMISCSVNTGMLHQT